MVSNSVYLLDTQILLLTKKPPSQTLSIGAYVLGISKYLKDRGPRPLLFGYLALLFSYSDVKVSYKFSICQMLVKLFLQCLSIHNFFNFLQIVIFLLAVSSSFGIFLLIFHLLLTVIDFFFFPQNDKRKDQTSVRFELTRVKHNALAAHRLNHSISIIINTE